MKFTVFTPTFNRAPTLHRPYTSLRQQTYRDFEWLIVDDGSCDETKQLIDGWVVTADFPIRYVWQPNSGKAAAINHGVSLAQGELFLILDSDDTCVPAALERFNHHWERIPDKRLFSGMTCHCMDENGLRIGDEFPIEDSTPIEIHNNLGVRGEKWGFHRTEVLAQHRFPSYGEKFVPDGLVWNRIARQYKIRYINECLRVYHRSHDGLSNARHTSPKSTAQYYLELIRDHRLTAKAYIRNGLNYLRFAYLAWRS
jgi:glycosyltransferase involved in cell wall biosynthesis